MDSEMGLSGKTVLVVGTGISGIAAVNLLATQSANIILLDGNTELSPETVAANFYIILKLLLITLHIFACLSTIHFYIILKPQIRK